MATVSSYDRNRAQRITFLFAYLSRRSRTRSSCRNFTMLPCGRRPREIDPFNRAVPEVLAVRVAIYYGLKKWDLLQVVAQRLAEFDVQNIDWVVSYAYATRRVESIEAAKKILLDAEQRFPNEPAISYNLACYEAQLNNIEVAKQYLKRTFELNPDWRTQASEHEDLKPLWNSLQVTIE